MQIFPPPVDIASAMRRDNQESPEERARGICKICPRDKCDSRQRQEYREIAVENGSQLAYDVRDTFQITERDSPRGRKAPPRRASFREFQQRYHTAAIICIDGFEYLLTRLGTADKQTVHTPGDGVQSRESDSVQDWRASTSSAPCTRIFTNEPTRVEQLLPKQGTALKAYGELLRMGWTASNLCDLLHIALMLWAEVKGSVR